MINARQANDLTERSRQESYKEILNDVNDLIKSTAQNMEYSARYNYPKKINDLEITPEVKLRVVKLLTDNGYKIDVSTGNLDEKDTENGYIDISWFRV